MKVFLSHHKDDKPFVREFNRMINLLGINTFFDERDILVGEPIPPRIYKEIEDADLFFYFMSKISIQSKWVEEELAIARMKEMNNSTVFICPIVIDDIEDIPFSFRHKRYADFRDRKIDLEADNLKLILETLKIDQQKFYASIANVKTTKTTDSIIAILSSSSELQINLNDIVYLTSRAVNIKDKDRNYRLSIMKDEISYRDINSKLKIILQEMSKLNKIEFLSSIINDLILRIKKFLIINSKLNGIDIAQKIDQKLLFDFQEATLSFNRRLSHFHFQLIILVFNLNIVSPYKQ